MVIWDDRIMELLRVNGPMSVGELADADEIRIVRSTVSGRCSRLAEEGYLNRYANGVYDITEKAEKYLDEEWDAENDRAIEPDQASVDVEDVNGTEQPEG
jgi:Mn-dependent DtxR family transcriptional regulator